MKGSGNDKEKDVNLKCQKSINECFLFNK